MTEAEKAFYEWFHVSGKSQYVLEGLREAFLAGWAAHEAAEAVLVDDRAS